MAINFYSNLKGYRNIITKDVIISIDIALFSIPLFGFCLNFNLKGYISIFGLGLDWGYRNRGKIRR